MRKIEYFNADPNGKGWLHKLNLKPNELVLVGRRTFRYNTERNALSGTLDHILTPVEGPK